LVVCGIPFGAAAMGRVALYHKVLRVVAGSWMNPSSMLFPSRWWFVVTARELRQIPSFPSSSLPLAFRLDIFVLQAHGGIASIVPVPSRPWRQKGILSSLLDRGAGGDQGVRKVSESLNFCRCKCTKIYQVRLLQYPALFHPKLWLWRSGVCLHNVLVCFPDVVSDRWLGRPLNLVQDGFRSIRRCLQETWGHPPTSGAADHGGRWVATQEQSKGQRKGPKTAGSCRSGTYCRACETIGE